MFFYLSKLLSHFALPLGFALLLLSAAIVIRRRRWGPALSVAGIFILAGFGSSVVSDAALAPLENAYPQISLEQTPVAQAILVLGRHTNMPNQRRLMSGLAGGGDRLLVALRLYKAGKAPLVFLSGGNIEYYTGAGQMPEARAAVGILKEWGVGEGAIEAEDQSRNTRENALFSHRVLWPRGIRRVLLVTSAYHMPRAVRVFKRVGFDVVPAPADFRSGWANPEFPFALLPHVEALNDASLAIREWIGLAVYRLRGWA